VRRTERSTQSHRDSGSQLLRLLLKLYSSAKLSALDFCELCHWSDLAGVPGAAFSLYAMRPGKQTGSYQDHLDRVLPDVKHLTTVATPGNTNRRAVRSVRDVLVRCIFESVEEEVIACPEQRLELRLPVDELDDDSVMHLPVYQNHPVVKQAERDGVPRPLPVAFYLDGVQFRSPAAGRNDAVLGFWCINLLSRKRHLINVLRGSDMCLCGCKGWCTIFPHLQAAQWMFESMSNGVRPPRRWDGGEWKPSCPIGKSARDCPRLSYRAALIYIKGDWSEHAHSLGLSSWSSTWAPCQFCSMTKMDLHTMYDDMPDGMQWHLRDGPSYDTSCSRCEVRVTLSTPHDMDSLLDSLRYRQPAKNPPRLGGRLIVADVKINDVQLLVGDRLEPSRDLPDPHNLEKSRLPIAIVFWRTRRDWKGRSTDCVTHRCPMFARCIGTTVHDNLAVDELHCLYFGPIMRYISAGMWRVVLANTWNFTGTVDQVVEQATRQISSELKVWEIDTHIPSNMRLGAITPKMLGKRKGFTTRDLDINNGGR